MGSSRRKQRWPTTAVVLALLVICFALNVILYGARVPVKVHGFVRHPRALRQVDGCASSPLVPRTRTTIEILRVFKTLSKQVSLLTGVQRHMMQPSMD